MDFIALDFETANHNRGSICAIGLAFVTNGVITDTKYFLVKPTPNYYDSINIRIHGIDERQTRDKKTFRQLWNELKPYFQNQNVVAHNAAFDLSALRYALDDSNLGYPDLNYYCTYRLCQRAMPFISRFGLKPLARYFNIYLNHHNAESDTKACALIALKLIEKNKVHSLYQLSKKFGFSVGKIISRTRTYSPFSILN